MMDCWSGWARPRSLINDRLWHSGICCLVVTSSRESRPLLRLRPRPGGGSLGAAGCGGRWAGRAPPGHPHPPSPAGGEGGGEEKKTSKKWNPLKNMNIASDRPPSASGGLFLLGRQGNSSSAILRRKSSSSHTLLKKT